MIRIGLIPFKCGSVRFKNKNFSRFREKYLLENTLYKLQNTNCLDAIYISTDCTTKVVRHMQLFTSEIDYSKVFVVPRDEDVTDDMNSVIQHIIESSEYKGDYTICLCQVTSPLWNSIKLNSAIRIHAHTKKSVVSVNPALQPNGAFYIFKKSDFELTNSIYHNGVRVIELNWKESIDIDYEHQLKIAEAVYVGGLF